MLNSVALPVYIYTMQLHNFHKLFLFTSTYLGELESIVKTMQLMYTLKSTLLLPNFNNN